MKRCNELSKFIQKFEMYFHLNKNVLTSQRLVPYVKDTTQNIA